MAGKSSGSPRVSPTTVMKVDVAVPPRHGVDVQMLLDSGAGRLPEIDADGALMLTFPRVSVAVENPTAQVGDFREPPTQVASHKIVLALLLPSASLEVLVSGRLMSHRHP